MKPKPLRIGNHIIQKLANLRVKCLEFQILDIINIFATTGKP